MPITFACVCGTEIEALDGHVGRKVMCPRCRSDLTVPAWSSVAVPERMPDLGIAIPAPAALTRRPRKARTRSVEQRASTIGLVVMAFLVAALAWGLKAGRDRREAREFFARAEAALAWERAAVAERGEVLAADERSRVAYRELSAKLEAEEVVSRRKQAVALLEAERDLKIIHAVDIPSRKMVAFLAEIAGATRSVIVENGILGRYIGPSRFEWETETPEDVAAIWAERFKGDGPYLAENVLRETFPPSLDALVVNRNTLHRFRFQLLELDRDGRATFKMEPADD